MLMGSAAYAPGLAIIYLFRMVKHVDFKLLDGVRFVLHHSYMSEIFASSLIQTLQCNSEPK